MIIPGWYTKDGELYILRTGRTEPEIEVSIEGKKFKFTKAGKVSDSYQYYKYIRKRYTLLYVLHTLGFEGVTKRDIKQDEETWSYCHPWGFSSE
jgi:hypothetical protein